MDTTIELSTDRETGTTDLKIDNSTEFKDFIIANSLIGSDKHSQVMMQLFEEDGKKTLTIGNCKIRGMELDLLIEFLTQKL